MPRGLPAPDKAFTDSPTVVELYEPAGPQTLLGRRTSSSANAKPTRSVHSGVISWLSAALTSPILQGTGPRYSPAPEDRAQPPIATGPLHARLRRIYLQGYLRSLNDAFPSFRLAQFRQADYFFQFQHGRMPSEIRAVYTKESGTPLCPRPWVRSISRSILSTTSLLIILQALGQRGMQCKVPVARMRMLTSPQDSS
jgi:hypothetical protein